MGGYVKKLIKEINSNNPKNIERLNRARSITDSMKPCGGFDSGSNPGAPVF
jgi:hypothetical protein